MNTSTKRIVSLPDSIEAITSSLPPKTDTTTYLTILESHLRPELLPTILGIIQDRELVGHIGWDLVELLVPLLPASEECLRDVARWGNPREVVLKILETLRHVVFDDEDGKNDGEEGDGQIEAEVDMDGAKAYRESPSQSLAVLKFKTLVSMLVVVHPRIKTKYPSRFVSSTLQAVLRCYSDATRLLPIHLKDDVTQSVIRLIKTLSEEKRPPLPPRQLTQDNSTHALDPIAEAEAGETVPQSPSKQEMDIQQRLLQSFTTHVLEEYLVSIPSDDEALGMAWAARLQERIYPRKNIPGRPTFGEFFAKRPALQTREFVVKQLAVSGRDKQWQLNERV